MGLFDWVTQLFTSKAAHQSEKERRRMDKEEEEEIEELIAVDII